MRQIITAFALVAFMVNAGAAPAAHKHSHNRATAHKGVAPAQAPEKPPNERAVGALADFSAAYGAWLIEARCRALDAKAHDDFAQTVEADRAALARVFEPGVVSAALAAGSETANDPKNADCRSGVVGGAENGAFGAGLAESVAASLKSLPAGYRLVVKK